MAGVFSGAIRVAAGPAFQLRSFFPGWSYPAPRRYDYMEIPGDRPDAVSKSVNIRVVELNLNQAPILFGGSTDMPGYPHLTVG